jgi:hypothetical protein
MKNTNSPRTAVRVRRTVGPPPGTCNGDPRPCRYATNTGVRQKYFPVSAKTIKWDLSGEVVRLRISTWTPSGGRTLRPGVIFCTGILTNSKKVIRIRLRLFWFFAESIRELPLLAHSVYVEIAAVIEAFTEIKSPPVPLRPMNGVAILQGDHTKRIRRTRKEGAPSSHIRQGRPSVTTLNPSLPVFYTLIFCSSLNF